MHSEVVVSADDVELAGGFTRPQRARGVVVFAHGSGSSRHSPRNLQVAAALQGFGLATLMIDLLTAEEEAVDLRTREIRFDIPLLGRRVTAAADWARQQWPDLALGIFGASTGAAAALIAAAQRPADVAAVVSRGGRPDLAAEYLDQVAAPTLLIVGENDDVVVRLNVEAAERIRAEKELALVPGATHLFEEPGALEEVARLAGEWFTTHMGSGEPSS